MDVYLEAFLALLFPRPHAEIDWSRGYEMLDKELQKIVREAELGPRVVDKLAKVWRKHGREEWVLIHVEIQAQEEAGFGRRMYVYNYRVFDRYNRIVVSLAMLADDRPGWRPTFFGYDNRFSSGVSSEFSLVQRVGSPSRAGLDTRQSFCWPSNFGIAICAACSAERR